MAGDGYTPPLDGGSDEEQASGGNEAEETVEDEAANAVALWAQCGGRSLCDDQDVVCMECPSGSHCHRFQEWYHQCVPGAHEDMEQSAPETDAQPDENQNEGSGGDDGGNDGGDEEQAPPQDGGSDEEQVSGGNEAEETVEEEAANAVALWAQCGGRSLCGDQDVVCMACPSGSHCQKQNAFYRQCVPGAAPEDAQTETNTETNTETEVEDVQEEEGTGAPTDDAGAEEAEIECEGPNMLVSNEDCTGFYICDALSSIHPLQLCAAGTLFSVAAGYCDWAPQVECNGVESVPIAG